MPDLSELIRQEGRAIADLRQALNVATNERDYDKADRTNREIEAHEQTLGELYAMHREDNPHEGGLIPCANCGNVIWPEGGPLCDTCKEAAESEKKK